MYETMGLQCYAMVDWANMIGAFRVRGRVEVYSIRLGHSDPSPFFSNRW